MDKLVYDETTNEIVNFVFKNLTTPMPNVADVPVGFDWNERTLWKYNGVDAVEMKTGQELADAQAALDATAYGKTKKNMKEAKDKWKPKLKNGTISKKEMEDAVLALLDRVFSEEA
jgi:hypothetical protein